MTTHNYAKIDGRMHYNWRWERLMIAHELGYLYISQSIVGTYRRTKSGIKTGQLCGGISAEAVRMFLNKIGEPIESPGGWRGGIKT